MIPNTSTIVLIDSLGSTHEVNFKTDPQDSSGPVAILEAGKEYQLTQDEFKNNTVVIDGGAGYGEFSIECALKGASKVYAFEPNPTLIPYLRENTSLFDSIQMIPKGVWVEDKDSFLYFRTTGTASASINEIQFNPNSIVAKERISVPVQLVDLGTTIDSVIEQNPGSQFALKLDIEGAEHQVIQYLSQTSRLNLLKKLWIEYHYGQQLLMNDIAPVFKFIVAEQKSPEMGLIIASN